MRLIISQQRFFNRAFFPMARGILLALFSISKGIPFGLLKYAHKSISTGHFLDDRGSCSLTLNIINLLKNQLLSTFILGRISYVGSKLSAAEEHLQDLLSVCKVL